MARNTLDRLALEAYPFRQRAQAAFKRGFLAEAGDRVAWEALTGCEAEMNGRTAARDAGYSANSIAEHERQLVALRIASPIRPLDRTSAPVDGLALFDQVRSPSLF